MAQPSTLNQDAGEVQYKKVKKPGKKRKPTGLEQVEVEQDPEVMILAPKTKPPLPPQNAKKIRLISYPHVNNLEGLLNDARDFSRSFHASFRALCNELLSYAGRDDKEVPNFLESCSLKVEHEEMAIRGLLAGFNSRLEKFKPFIQKLPYPVRDGCREFHPLNGFSIASISNALTRRNMLTPLPTDMAFNQDELLALGEDIRACEGVQPILHDPPATVEPLEDYYHDDGETSSASNSGTKKNKKILDEKDGVRKLSFPAYHLRVMKLLADKGIFGKSFRPYEKRHQRVINNAIAAVSGDDMVQKFAAFLQESYQAYEEIFAEGKRSVFGPADVRGDVEQHLAQFYHYFKSRVSEEPLIS